jgi:hypothetical protein
MLRGGAADALKIICKKGVNLMGYVHDTQMANFIQPADFAMSAGTWAAAIASNLVSYDRSAADASVTVLVPIRIPTNANAYKGAKLTSIDVNYSIATGAADDFATVELEKITLGANAVANTGAAVTTTIDAAHDTAAERKAIANHRMTVTITTPEFLDDDCCYWLQMVIDNAANTVLKFYGAVAHFTLRV